MPESKVIVEETANKRIEWGDCHALFKNGELMELEFTGSLEQFRQDPERQRDKKDRRYAAYRARC